MNDDKNLRQPITEDTNLMHKNVRPKIGRNLKLDASDYTRAYPDKKLMWIADNDTDLQVWLDNGAQPVPSNLPDRKIYKGLNDRKDNGWVSRVGGKDKEGKTYYLFLLMIDPQTYNELKIEPEMERQQEIEKAMRIGANTSDISAHLPGGGGIQTYAPNLPVGEGRGFNQIRSNG